MIMQRLKSETKPWHDQTEKLAYADKIMNGLMSLEEYKDLMLKNYILHAVVEKAIEQGLSKTELEQIDFNSRRKTTILEKELKVLEVKAGIPTHINTSEFSISTVAQAIGAMYVLEGSTLGGAIIKRELMKNKAIAAKSPFYYYGCYGANTGTQWKNFIGIAMRFVNQPTHEEQTVQKAVETFAFFSQVLSKKYTPELSVLKTN